MQGVNHSAVLETEKNIVNSVTGLIPVRGVNHRNELFNVLGILAILEALNTMEEALVKNIKVRQV